MALDPRLITVTLQVNGGFKVYTQELAITAKGQKFNGAIFNECEVTISNLDKATQDFILTETSPYNLNRTPKIITIDAGRESYGVSRIFEGTVFTSKPTQPPDIAVVLRCLENGFASGDIITRNQNQTSLSNICKKVAEDNNLTLTFQATDKNISNYTYTGAANGQLNKLAAMGAVDTFIDNNQLIIKNKNVPLNTPIRVISKETGMIGIPQLNEWGVIVKFLLDNRTTVGSAIQVISDIYPAANGYYNIYKLGFEIASRDTPFYYIAEAARQGL